MEVVSALLLTALEHAGPPPGNALRSPSFPLHSFSTSQTQI